MEEKIFNTFKIQVLTPVHIGSGEEKLKKELDYIVDKNKTYFIDWDILLQDKKIQNEITDALLKNNTTVIKELASKLNAFASVINSPIHSNEISKNLKNKFNQNPIIPGSSIKGSIRSVLLEYLIKNKKNKKSSVTDLNSIFGNATEGKDFMRFFQITDAEFNQNGYIESKIFNLTKTGSNFNSGWKHGSINNTTFQPTGFVFSYEIIPINAQSLFNIVINQVVFKKVFNNNNNDNIKRKLDIIDGGFKELFKIVNIHSQNLITKEIDFHKRYNNAQYSGKLVESWNNLLNEVFSAMQNNNTCCIMRVGQGSGFHSITGDWIFESHHHINQIIMISKNPRGAFNNELSAKSRRVAFVKNENDYSFYPFGFIKITLHSDDEYERLQQEPEFSKNKISVPGKIETEKIILKENENSVKVTDKEITPPKYYEGRIEQGKTIVPALIVEAGIPNRVKLLIKNNEIELPLTGYKSPIEKVKYINVIITQYTSGSIKQVNYHSEYKS